jgi:hypothetical protein
MLVGHNPSLEEFRAMLYGQAPNYPTAALGTIDLSIDTWDEVSPGCGTLAAFVTARAARLPVEFEHLSHRGFEVVVIGALSGGSDHLGITPDGPAQLTAIAVERVGDDRRD